MGFADRAARVFEGDQVGGLSVRVSLVSGCLGRVERTMWWRMPGWPRAREVSILSCIQTVAGMRDPACVRSDKAGSDKPRGLPLMALGLEGSTGSEDSYSVAW